MPVMCGSITQRTATAEIAASTALPPARRTSMAVSVASGCDGAALPFFAITGERPGKWKSRAIKTNPALERGKLRDCFDLLDGHVALRGAQRHRKAGEHVHDTDHHDDEECRRAGLTDEQEFDQHRDEQDHRQD